MSLATYGMSFAYLLLGARRLLGGSYREFRLPRASDIESFVRAVRERFRPRAAS